MGFMDLLLFLAYSYDSSVVGDSQMKGARNENSYYFDFGTAFAGANTSVIAQRNKNGSGARTRTLRVDLSKEKVGGESGKFLSVVGNWWTVEDGGKKVLAVDGRQWLRGQPAGGLAEKARHLRIAPRGVHRQRQGICLFPLISCSGLLLRASAVL